MKANAIKWITAITAIVLGGAALYALRLQQVWDEKAELYNFSSLMQASDVGAQRYWEKHKVFPKEMSSELNEYVCNWLRKNHAEVPSNTMWFHSDEIKSLQQALDVAKRAGPRQVVYCPIIENDVCVGFLILGKDSKGSLCEGVDGTPMIIHEGRGDGLMPTGRSANRERPAVNH